MTIINEKIIVIGGGPAGISCSIQLKRYGLDPLIIEASKIGGLAVNANLVENYCGYQNGIKGTDLVNIFTTQLINHKVRIAYSNVYKVEINNGKYILYSSHGIYKTEHLVVASGTTAKKVSFESDKIIYEIDKLLSFKKIINKNIIIVGAGDAAFDYALNLAEFNKVHILNRNNKIKCLNLLKDRVDKNKNIEYSEFSSVKNVIETSDGLILDCYDQIKNTSYKLNCDYLIVAIGRIANTAFLSENLINNSNNNLYIIGDANNGLYRQISIACGDGLKTAMIIYNKIGDDHESSGLCRQ